VEEAVFRRDWPAERVQDGRLYKAAAGSRDERVNRSLAAVGDGDLDDFDVRGGQSRAARNSASGSGGSNAALE
jgi:hypothetical protein